MKIERHQPPPSTAMPVLKEMYSWIANQQREPCDYPTLVRHLEQMAALFLRTSKDQHRSMVAEFHNFAGQLPYFQDCDIGAMILEGAADSAGDSVLRTFLYTEALFRATWCARGASAAGEGVARGRHVKILYGKIQNAAR